MESSGFGTSGLAVNTITMAGHSRGMTGLVPGGKPAEGLCDAPIPPRRQSSHRAGGEMVKNPHARRGVRAGEWLN